MKKIILLLAITMAGAQAQAKSLSCSNYTRVNTTKLVVDYHAGNAVAVSYIDMHDGAHLEMDGQLNAESSTASKSVYSLAGGGMLQINKVVDSFPDFPDCPRCFVAPSYYYTAKLETGVLSEGFYNCNMSH